MSNCKEWQIADGIELQRRDGLYFVNGLPEGHWMEMDYVPAMQIYYCICDDVNELRNSQTTTEPNG